MVVTVSSSKTAPVLLKGWTQTINGQMNANFSNDMTKRKSVGHPAESLTIGTGRGHRELEYHLRED